MILRSQDHSKTKHRIFHIVCLVGPLSHLQLDLKPMFPKPSLGDDRQAIPTVLGRLGNRILNTTNGADDNIFSYASAREIHESPRSPRLQAIPSLHHHSTLGSILAVFETEKLSPCTL
jgi:hypothetical protein